MLIDLHCHTNRSQDAFIEPGDAVREAREAGLGALCLTEHDIYWDQGEILELRREHDFPVLRGVEVFTELGHVLAFGLESFDLALRSFPRLADACADAGGALVLAHPYRRFYRMTTNIPTDADVTLALRRKGWDSIHAIEIWNGETRYAENLLAAAAAERLMLPTTGGSDTHRTGEFARTYTDVDGDIADERDLVDAIRQGRIRGVASDRVRTTL